MEKLIHFFKEEEGATAAEYGIMVALITVAVIITVTAIGNQLNSVYQKINSVLENAG
jgi:pilus assembly protein Flp/PilA